MKYPTRILLQTTIPHTGDDWHIGRFSLLRNYLGSLRDASGERLFDVTARNLERDEDGRDPVLGSVDRSDFDQIWIFAVDSGNGLTSDECSAITAFREHGGGLLTTRDHMDLGSSLCTLGGVGAAHFFHSKHQEPDPSRHEIDDPYTTDISWPNYHSGSNGDYQRIAAVGTPHELLRNPDSPSGIIEYLPAHPHEGAVGVPEGESTARVIATGTSKVTGHPFNIAVAFERGIRENGGRTGRGIADSSFHHFVDYNLDPRLGAPSFVVEPPGNAMQEEPRALSDAFAYIRNLATWLTPE
jgi:hypothetical protein